MSDTIETLRRGKSAGLLWWGLWLSLGVLLSTQALDAWLRSAPLAIWALWLLPLLVFVPGLLRDRLRSVTWLSFVSLLYFILAVERVFAEPGSGRAVVQLVAVIALFLCTMFYVRQRGRELREHSQPTASVSDEGGES
ncbi:MAG: hypothetical protein Cons2KO_22810 [Congregibacter sp.]